FTATISQLEGVEKDPSHMIQLVVEADYEDYLKSAYPNAQSRLDDLDQLATFANQFSTLQDFLAQMALLTNVGAEDERPARYEEEQLRLSTIHQAKGLEFDVVFVIMLCDGMFPSERSMQVPGGEEEERRLFYVAITRARNELYLTYPLVRDAGGGPSGTLRSRFLREMPAELVEEKDLARS